MNTQDARGSVLAAGPAGWGGTVPAPSWLPMRSVLLDGLPPHELRLVQDRLVSQICGEGSKLIAQGSWHGAMYILRSGTLSVDATLDSGETRHLSRLMPGECVGEMSLLSGLPASATVSALVDSEVWALRHDDFLELLASCPVLARTVAVILSQRLSAMIRGRTHRFARLMQVRVHEAVMPGLTEAISRSVATDLGAPLLVVDQRRHSVWQRSEELPGWESILANRTLLEELRPGHPARPLVCRLPDLSAENWVRLQATVPEFLTYALVLTDAVLSPSDVHVTDEATVSVALWPEAAGPVPAGVNDVALLVAEPANSRSALGHASPLYRANVIRTISRDARQGDANLEWVARHLAGLKVGVALGGGMSRGLAHFGVLRRLLRAGVPIDYLAGCSIGAVVAAGFAYGLDLDELEWDMSGASSHAIKLTLSRRSLLSSNGLKRLFQTAVGETRIEDLPVPLAVVAVDVMQSREVVLDRGLVWKAVLASVSVPGVYPPVSMGDLWLVDGGLLDPLPAAVSRSLGADIVLGVNVGGRARKPPMTHRAGPDGPGCSPHLVDVLLRSFDVMGTEIGARASEGANVTIAPEVQPLGLRDFARARSLVPAGERAVGKVWDEISTVLPWLRQVRIDEI